MKFQLTANTHVGEVRDHNEDNFFVCSNLTRNEWSFDKQVEYELGELGAVLIVADGMGGMNAGEVASEIAVESSKQAFETKGKSVDLASSEAITTFIKDVIHKAHNDILSRQKSDPETQGMGTTLILGWVLNGVAYIGWCGDSRAYLYNPKLKSSGRAKQYEEQGLRVKGNLALVSKDHSYVQTLVDKGDLTDSQAFFHPESNIITQSLGQSGQKISPSTTSLTLFEGDKLILCSDGINAMLEDSDIESICNANENVSETSTSLISQANEKGGHDNSTVTIFHALSASYSVDHPLANSINRDLSEGKATKTNLLKIIVLAVLIGGTLGSLYFSFKDKLNFGKSSVDPTEKYLVLEEDFSLENVTLNQGDTLFYNDGSSRIKIEIRIDELKSVADVDSTEFENEIARYFYVVDKSSPDITNELIQETILNEESKGDSKVESSANEVKVEKTTTSESVKPVATGTWRVQLSTNQKFQDKGIVFYDLDSDSISVLQQGKNWVYYYGCFNSKEEAQSWIDDHPRYQKNGQKPLNTIPCKVEDDKPLEVKSQGVEGVKVKDKEGGDSLKLTPINPNKEKQQDEVQESKITNEEQVDSSKVNEENQVTPPDSSVSKLDSSQTEVNQNI